MKEKRIKDEPTRVNEDQRLNQRENKESEHKLTETKTEEVKCKKKMRHRNEGNENEVNKRTKCTQETMTQ